MKGYAWLKTLTRQKLSAKANRLNNISLGCILNININLGPKISMKILIAISFIILFSACSGGTKNNEVSERELYGEKRADCTSTKRTDEGANVMQCANIRPDAKTIEDSSENLSEDYDPEDYGQYQNIQE